MNKKEMYLKICDGVKCMLLLFLGFFAVIVVAYIIVALIGGFAKSSFDAAFYLSLIALTGSFVLLGILMVQFTHYAREVAQGYQSICEKEIEKERTVEMLKEQNRHRETLIEKENERPGPTPGEKKWNDQKEILLKWIETGKPQEGEKEIRNNLAEELKNCIDNIFGK